MSKEISDDVLNQIALKAIDILYEVYEVEHSFNMCLYLRCNGDGEFLGELLSKEEFRNTLYSNNIEWIRANNVICHYLLKQYRDE